MNTTAMSRVSAGIPTGGQFARSAHSESADVHLTGDGGSDNDAAEPAAPAPAAKPAKAKPLFTAATADITAYDPAARTALLNSLAPKSVHDDGCYRTLVGAKYEGWRPAADIAKAVRGDLKDAQKSGALPVGVTYQLQSEGFAGGQGIRITAIGLPDRDLRRVDEQGRMLRRPTDESTELDTTLQAIGGAYDRAMSGTDLYNPVYFCSTNLETESMREFREYERAAKPIQSAWRNDGAGVPNFPQTVHGVELGRRFHELQEARKAHQAAHPEPVFAD